eukprot:CAMPEP_0175155942 /NCGR_PEP_ID=MMETSP0087-20121206/21296_1 /TAXON_ID=136419 /ORGANISM="Unknown Unknown, Strain D1" /LENGTH=103 /DNA_ID=CAMNT_0016443235 /DNA_START=19 /DNA_END=330 /DNA_ORIENTATION=+
MTDPEHKREVPEVTSDKVTLLMKKTEEEVIQLARENIDLQLTNITAVDDIESKSTKLENKTKQFHKTTDNLKQRGCWYSYRNCVILSFVFLALALLVYFVASQ